MAFAIAIVIDAPLKWIQCTLIGLFTVRISDCDCNSDVAITKSDMGVAPISSD